ncbi:unnamed protein product [Pedinophyceae sp. YPF-701]|nr:unnamed protein product [Pedinophyceae sp. YPF-701]
MVPCARDRAQPDRVEAAGQRVRDATALSRRCALALVHTFAALLSLPLVSPLEAVAALVQFGQGQTLSNSYVLIRAAESEAESEGVTMTSPAQKNSTLLGISPQGRLQLRERTLPALGDLGVCEDGECWIWPSITQNSYQTAEVVARRLNTGRSAIVPEYSFLDARGVGAYENTPVKESKAAIAALDKSSARLKPPPGTDGTPNESAEDVLVRLRQVLSITETQYGGATVILIAPDSDVLSILQSAVLGIDLRAHGTFAMAPGEVRVLRQRGAPFADAGVDVGGEVREESASTTIRCARPPACLE